MDYIELSKHGGPEVMRLATGEKPHPTADEVLIQVAACGVNRPDVLQREGLYPPPPGASPILGLEVAGTIIAVGDKVQRWQPGEQVCALTNGGGYAGYAVAPEGQCLPVPGNLSLQQAAALPETFFTVWSNLIDRAKLQAGETLLIHGGSSGIGTTAIQLAASIGARVFVTAGSAEKCTACVALGAEQAINYKTEDFVECLKAATDGAGVDVILDMVGGEYVDKNIQLAATDGRIVNIAYLAGAKVEVNLLPVMLKRLTLTGSTLRPQQPEVKAQIARALEKQIWPQLATGKIHPQIAASFPLAEVAEAHRFMEAGKHIGKIVLTL